MGELWRDLVEMLRRHPALWLPVLIADLLGYVVNLGRISLLRAIVMHRTAQQSVLGGAVVHSQMSASAMQSTTVIALLLTWLTYLIRILLYAGAFVATAALLRAYVERAEKPLAQIGPALSRQWGGLFEIALRALAIYAVAALFLSWLTASLSKHGQAALLRSGGFEFGLTLLVLLVLSALLPPVALRVLTNRAPGKDLTRSSQQLAFILVTVAALLASFVTINSRELSQIPLGARYPLEIVGSLLVALPYVLLFTGLALLARRMPRDEEVEPAAD